jgi:ASC-1-like (ASCH) protein
MQYSPKDPLFDFQGHLMSDPKTQEMKLGYGVKRSGRNKFAEEIEHLVRDLAPFPATYDVNATQPTNFSEFAYTEFLGGMYITTQSIDINTRVTQAASEVQNSNNDLDKVILGFKDKYELNSNVPVAFQNIKAVAFMPGSNLPHLVSMENLNRALFEDSELMVKAHPMTHPDHFMAMSKSMGLNRLIPKELSGHYFLKQADRIYTTSANEFGVLGVALGKEVINLSQFESEAYGAYFPFMLCLKRKDKDPKVALNNILGCEFSGVILPHHTNIEERIKAFYDKAMELRSIYSPLYYPPKMPKLQRLDEGAKHAPQ